MWVSIVHLFHFFLYFSVLSLSHWCGYATLPTSFHSIVCIVWSWWAFEFINTLCDNRWKKKYKRCINRIKHILSINLFDFFFFFFHLPHWHFDNQFFLFISSFISNSFPFLVLFYSQIISISLWNIITLILRAHKLLGHVWEEFFFFCDWFHCGFMFFYHSFRLRIL